MGNGVIRAEATEQNGTCIERPYLGGKSWYYGNISRAQCDTLLNNHGLDGDFLIRDSETNVSISYLFIVESDFIFMQIENSFFINSIGRVSCGIL